MKVVKIDDDYYENEDEDEGEQKSWIRYENSINVNEDRCVYTG